MCSVRVICFADIQPIEDELKLFQRLLSNACSYSATQCLSTTPATLAWQALCDAVSVSGHEETCKILCRLDYSPATEITGHHGLVRQRQQCCRVGEPKTMGASPHDS